MLHYNGKNVFFFFLFYKWAGILHKNVLGLLAHVRNQARGPRSRTCNNGLGPIKARFRLDKNEPRRSHLFGFVGPHTTSSPWPSARFQKQPRASTIFLPCIFSSDPFAFGPTPTTTASERERQRLRAQPSERVDGRRRG